VPIVSFGGALTTADGEPVKSFDGWVWDLIASKQRLSDQVLDAAFDVSGYAPGQVRRAIRNMLRALDEAGGAVVAPPPPEESEQAEHRRRLGRYRGLARERVAEIFLHDREVSRRFLEKNDASRASTLAQQLVRERLGRWLDHRATVVDLGCGSNPLRDLPCEVVGIDRHGVNGARVGDIALTGLSESSVDLAVMSLSMWGTTRDRLDYLQEAKRILRPLGKLIIVEPSGPFGGVGTWQTGADRLRNVVGLLGMRLAEASEHTIDASSSLVSFVIDNSSASPVDDIDPEVCHWLG